MGLFVNKLIKNKNDWIMYIKKLFNTSWMSLLVNN